jgi:hypothetical protein
MLKISTLKTKAVLFQGTNIITKTMTENRITEQVNECNHIWYQRSYKKRM